VNSADTISSLDERRLRTTIVALAWPVALQSMAGAILSLTVIFFIGRLGPAAITAVSLSETIVSLPVVVVSGLSVGVTAIVARHAGARELGEASSIAGQAMLLAFVLGVLFAIVLWFSADLLLWVYRAQPDVMSLGRDYIRVSAPATIPVFIASCGVAILHALGDTRTPMVAMIIVEALAAGLGYALITGLWGAPALGVLGAGISRAVASSVGAVVVLGVLTRGKGLIKYDLRAARLLNWPSVRRILKVGLPALGDQLATQGAMHIYVITISSLGTAVYAGHALAMRVLGFTYVPLNGLTTAAAILVGQSLGAGRPDLARRGGYLAQRYCAAIMACVGLVTFVLARQLIDIFTDDPAVIQVGAQGLRVWAVAMPGVATSLTLASGLRGAGDTRWVLLLTAIGMWTMRVGMGAAMVFLLRLGVLGAWISAVSDQFLRAMLMWRRFAGGRWQKIEV
jgi:putative MATE family efflux protein